MAFKFIILLAAGLASLPCNAEFRDPTQPAYHQPSTIAADTDTTLVLSAIWISPRSKRATINGISVKQGQTIVIEHTPVLKPALPASANSVVINDKEEEHPIPAKQQLDTAHTETAYIPAHSTKIKVISIHKNSVIISQNGERKTLQLVQRSYKTR
ncbi:hypothetical protein [Candidatus Methylobacter oryzae]|uniref:Uncharacterized protein n=1 Tax=Candidatus Methylobacter oryzae TaxID=2497749 RepID=A0ABY3CFQ7_9GAMM|nr:hypothetical protein [Candidatus Methylobacter oryzae]TRX02317.1 hypothetical protein EKO24_002805 [Candidatus Methylobacter oryzae]